MFVEAIMITGEKQIKQNLYELVHYERDMHKVFIAPWRTYLQQLHNLQQSPQVRGRPPVLIFTLGSFLSLIVFTAYPLVFI